MLGLMDPIEPESSFMRMMREGAERSERAIAAAPLRAEEFRVAMAIRKALLHAVCDRLHAQNAEMLAIIARIEAKWAAKPPDESPPAPASPA